MKRTPVTVQGAEKLKEELKHLKTVMRQKITEAIAEARAHGDLKENAEYHAAREQQSFNEGRIQQIETRLAHAHIIDISTIECTGKVIFGSTVHLENIDTEETVVYQIVGEDEADIKHAKISVSSPIARAVIGKLIDDEVEVNTPGGIVEYAIIKVEHL